MKKSKLISEAYEIAVKSLRKCYKQDWIHAWTKHFTDIWSRDSIFASFWALDLWDNYIVKKNLLKIISNLSSDWQIFLRYWSSSFFQVLKFFGLDFWKDKARYFQDKWNNVSQDQNSLFLILLYKYIKDTWDILFAKDNIKQIQKVFNWNETQLKWDFIFWANYTTWQDSVKKPWYNLINNVFYLESIKSYSKILESIWEENLIYKDYFEEKKLKFIDFFWNKEKWYFNDWIDNREVYDYFSLDGNMFSIFFWITDSKKSEKILNFLILNEENLLSPFWAKTNYPNYSFSQVCRRYHLFWMADYHNNSLYWLWLWSLVSVVLYKTWNSNLAFLELEKISKIIKKYKNVYEVYDKAGKPLKRFFYSSEENFAWSSSFFIVACNILRLK